MLWNVVLNVKLHRLNVCLSDQGRVGRGARVYVFVCSDMCTGVWLRVYGCVGALPVYMFQRVCLGSGGLEFAPILPAPSVCAIFRVCTIMFS